MTDRPDRLLTEARARQRQLARIAEEAKPRPWRVDAVVLEDASLIRLLADALGAAQKTSDGLYLAVKMSAKEQECLRTRVRQLEEALTLIKSNAESWHGPPPNGGHVRALAVIATWCDEVLAAKENTTP